LTVTRRHALESLYQSFDVYDERRIFYARDDRPADAELRRVAQDSALLRADRFDRERARGGQRLQVVR